jgi:sodium/potassium-transporting ATPase subunit alpha
LGEGNRVPADARLVEATFLKLNNAPLTGESEPRHASPILSRAIHCLKRRTCLCRYDDLPGSGTARSPGDATEFGRLARLTQGAAATQPIANGNPSATGGHRHARAWASFFVLGNLIGRTFWENSIFAIGILVITSPKVCRRR